MSYSNSKNKVPKVLMLKTAAPRAGRGGDMSNLNSYELPIHGQGVFLFSLVEEGQPITSFGGEERIHLAFLNQQKTDGFMFHIGLEHLTLFRISDGQKLDEVAKGLIPVPTAFYWVSLDSHHLCLKFGIGEARQETMAFMYSFQTDDIAQNNTNEKLLESLTTVLAHPVEIVQPLKLLRDPIVQNVPLKVKSTDELTMDDIANNTYLPKSNLSPAAQKLYDNVSGKRFVLNDVSFPQFTQAIEYSIADPNGWCYHKLKEKSQEFGPDAPQETYLRITLGQNSGESPGVPYVMEIWPPGHYSPVHNHAGANAIIRVLHGAISVKLFPFLNDSQGFVVQTFSEGDITWISPELNQIHQLKNLDGNTETCITIQCYMYDTDDQVHYDFFDYVDDSSTIQHFEPNSDADFATFKAQMKEEWDNHLKTEENRFLYSNL